MNREVFVIKNNTASDLEIKTFGIIVSSGQTIDLGNFDNAVLSDEIYALIQNGDLTRVINGNVVDMDSAYYQSIEPYTLLYNNIVTVSKTGGTYIDIQAAIDSITDANASNMYLIKVGEGVYTENITMKNYVNI